MAKTMKAAVVHAFGEPLGNRRLPHRSPCGQRRLAGQAGAPLRAWWFVAALGSGVTGLNEGDPVSVAWLHDACGRCEYCMTGWDSLCESQHNTGYSVDHFDQNLTRSGCRDTHFLDPHQLLIRRHHVEAGGRRADAVNLPLIRHCRSATASRRKAWNFSLEEPALTTRNASIAITRPAGPLRAAARRRRAPQRRRKPYVRARNLRAR
jgi:Alcohol dehydrogenase GroES-like domain